MIWKPSTSTASKYKVWMKPKDLFSAWFVFAFCVAFQPWQSEEEGSWLREYPVTLMQFFRYLYHNVPDLAPMWHSPDFLCALAASVFPFNIRPYSEMVRLYIFPQSESEAKLNCAQVKKQQDILHDDIYWWLQGNAATLIPYLLIHKSLVLILSRAKGMRRFCSKIERMVLKWGLKAKNLITTATNHMDWSVTSLTHCSYIVVLAY